MFAAIYHKLKHLVLTFRVSILTIFISLFLISMLSLILITYYRSLHSITYVAYHAMKTAAVSVNQKITDEINDGIIETEFSSRLLQSGVVDPRNLDEIGRHLFNLMWVEAKTLPSIQSAFWGDEVGNYIIASKNSDNTISTEYIDRQKSAASDIVKQYNMFGTLISSQPENHLFCDPRGYPWYLSSKLSKKTFITDVYPNPLTNPSILTITVATPTFTSQEKFIGVFGLNIHLAYLRKFIESMSVSRHSIIYIVRDDGKVVAYPGIEQYTHPALMDISELPKPWITQSFAYFKKTHSAFIQLDYQGKHYWAAYMPIHYFSQPAWWIGVVVPEEDFVGELHKTNVITLIVSFIILFLGILLVSTLVTRVVRPLKNLVKETEKIKDFQLADDIRIKSRIKEVIQLTHAMNAMKKGLRTFQKYVPANLVRQLIEAGEEANVGGAKKELVILFTDIDQFTHIAEHMDPKALMAHLCDYFDEVSKIIVECHGTIDKYIGDAVMAFWGAPFAVTDPCQLAARAALRCKNTLATFNHQWKQAGKPVLLTRIGIHVGEAIVGNLGSSERLNYTAVGDAINMTFRLQSVNKLYGTRISVSEKVYQLLKKEFVFRKMDYVKLKGKGQASFIYELLAERVSDISFDVNAYTEKFEKGFAAYQQRQWDEAIQYFSECKEVYSADHLANVFIQRCEQFKQQPPPDDWRGAWEVM